LNFFPVSRQDPFVQSFSKNDVKEPARTVDNSMSNLGWKPSGPHDLFGFTAIKRLRTPSCISKLVNLWPTGRSSIAGIQNTAHCSDNEDNTKRRLSGSFMHFQQYFFDGFYYGATAFFSLISSF
jgi:hypothetical protein